MLHQLHSPAKDPRQGNPCSGANKTPSSLLTAVLTKISSENCCSRDHQLTYARSANPKNCSKSTRPFSSIEWVGSGYETKGESLEDFDHVLDMVGRGLEY